MTDKPHYSELAKLIGKRVRIVLTDGKDAVAAVSELHVEGFYAGYDIPYGTRVVFYPKDVTEVLDQPPPRKYYIDCKECGCEYNKPASEMTKSEIEALISCRCICHPKYNGCFCSICQEPQYCMFKITGEDGPITCMNGHEGVPGLKDNHPF